MIWWNWWCDNDDNATATPTAIACYMSHPQQYPAATRAAITPAAAARCPLPLALTRPVPLSGHKQTFRCSVTLGCAV